MCRHGLCRVDGLAMALAVMDFRFMGGSMGSVVGESARLVEEAPHVGYRC